MEARAPALQVPRSKEHVCTRQTPLGIVLPYLLVNCPCRPPSVGSGGDLFLVAPGTRAGWHRILGTERGTDMKRPQNVVVVAFVEVVCAIGGSVGDDCHQGDACMGKQNMEINSLASSAPVYQRMGLPLLLFGANEWSAAVLIGVAVITSHGSADH